MSPGVLVAASVSLLALAMPALAADQDAAGSGTTMRTLPNEGAPDYGSASATYAPGSWTPTSTLSDARLVAAGLADAGVFTPTGYLQVTGWSHGRWSFASVIEAPDVAPSMAAGNIPVAWDTHPWDRGSDLFPVTFAPLVASYSLNATSHIAFSLGLNTPSSYGRQGRLLAASANIWALIPKVAYTQVLSSSDQGDSTVVAVGTFSRKQVEGFQGAAMGRIEALVMKRNANGWGYGGVAAAMQQPNVGTAPYGNPAMNADQSAGLAWGVGPQISWSSRWLGSGVEFQYRWLYEPHGANGHTDQPMMLSATLHL